MENLLAQNKIYWGQSPEYNNVPRRKIFNGEKTEIIPKNIIDGAESTRSAQNHVDALLGEKNSFDKHEVLNDSKTSAVTIIEAEIIRPVMLKTVKNVIFFNY